MVEGRIEMQAAVGRFRALMAEWDLGRSAVARLLAVQASGLGPDLVPAEIDAFAERRMRLLDEIGSLAAGALRDPADVVVWLRRPGGVPLPGVTVTPLAFMAGAAAGLVALRDALREGAR